MSVAEILTAAKTQPVASIPTLRGSILRQVSRSFYLSIFLLPKKLRGPVSLGYLLARASDALADTAELPIKLRVEKLRTLAGAIQAEASDDAIAELGASVSPLQKNEAERALIESLPACLAWLDGSEALDRKDVQMVLEKINSGQILDLERFRDPKQISALETAADLDEYTYLVAGSAGEFWTRLCFRHLKKFSSRGEPEMLELGKRYGQGLQLINILRDAGADLRASRCYFPNQEVTAVAMEPAQILREPQRFEPIYRKWRERAEQGVKDGIDYSREIRNRRVRIATVLPALIGARTLALLREAGGTMLHRHIKVSRKEVRAIVRSLTSSFGSRSRIDSLYRELSR
jgi:farnesyl-diphosphate farnesyltransferase